MSDTKWWTTEEIQSGHVSHLLLLSFGQNGKRKDFIMYCCVPRKSLVVFILVQISVPNCDPWEQLEDKITCLVTNQSLLCVFL